jgi:hypothetical protein
MRWHREDWTAEMLPPGTRPLTKGEVRLPGDSIFPTGGSDSRRNKWQTVERDGWVHPQNPCNEGSYHSRTTRPLLFTHAGHEWTWHRAGDPCPCAEKRIVQVLLNDGSPNRDPAMPEFWDWEGIAPDEVKIIGWRYTDADKPDPYAELKKAHAAGKVIQIKLKLSGAWTTFNGDFDNLDSRHEIRIKPDVPLGPEDVPPGSVIKTMVVIQAQILRINKEAVFILGSRGTPYEVTFEELQSDWQINRSIPMTGKWNPDAWEACEK